MKNEPSNKTRTALCEQTIANVGQTSHHTVPAQTRATLVRKRNHGVDFFLPSTKLNANDISIKVRIEHCAASVETSSKVEKVF